MNPPKNIPENCQGFALIIALSLMAFVLLLLLSITTLVPTPFSPPPVRPPALSTAFTPKANSCYSFHFVLRIELSLSQLHADQRITLAALAKAIGGGWSGK